MNFHVTTQRPQTTLKPCLPAGAKKKASRFFQSLSNKLRIVYLPFILIAVGFFVGYTFLNWLLVIRWNLFTLNEEILNLWLPLCLPGLAIFIWLHPRLKALRAKKSGGTDFRGLFVFASWIVIALPTALGQHYLTTATGKLTHLAKIGQIEQLPKTKYYTVQDAFFDKADASIETAGYYVGRYNSGFEMVIYFTCPVDDYGDKHPGHVWLGTIYKNQIGGHLSDDERESRFHDFFNSSLAAYNNLDLRQFSYLEKLGPSDDDKAFETAIKRSSLYQPGTSNIVLEAHVGNFADRNGDKLAQAFEIFEIGAVICFLILAIAPVDKKEMTRILSGEKPKTNAPIFAQMGVYDAPVLARMIFVPNRVGFITPLLIDLNLLVFVSMVFAGLGFISFDSKDLLAWGGNFKPAVMDGEFWRLVTSLFVHGGLIHLVGNVFMLFLVGLMLEPKLGHTLFFICYLICGMAGGVASIALHPTTVSVGASGAIMGALGVLISVTFLEDGKNPNQRNGVIKTALFIVGYNLLMGFVMGGVDNAAHFGGLLCGLFLGILSGVFPELLGHRKSRVAKKQSGPPLESTGTEKESSHL